MRKLSLYKVTLVVVLLLGTGYLTYHWAKPAANAPTSISAVAINPDTPFVSFTTQWGCFKRQGDGLALTVENTLNDEERRQGLSSRPPLPANQGMLFTSPENDWHNMWMHNMLFPLDFLVLDRYLRVTRTFTDVPPCPTSGACPNFMIGPGAHVIELGAGTATRNIILPGQQFDWYQGTKC